MCKTQITPLGFAYTIGEAGADVNDFHKIFVKLLRPLPGKSDEIPSRFYCFLVRSEAEMVKLRVLPETKVGV